MKKIPDMKKGVAFLTAGIIMLTSAVGCGKTGKTSPGGDGTQSGGSANAAVTYPMKTVQLTYAMRPSTAWSKRYKNYTDLPFVKELEKKTGVELKMVQPQDSSAMNLLIASGDLPDIINYNWITYYTGGETKAVEDGIIYGMSKDFVKKNAPDYWKEINSTPNLLKQVETPSHQITGFAFILGDPLLKSGQGLMVRDDWCKELGIQIPQTADQFESMLKDFKDKKGAQVPLSLYADENAGSLESCLKNGFITSAFNLPTSDFYLKNGKTVTAGFAQKEYKNALAWLHKLYQEKLLDPNFATVKQDTINANMLTGKSGVTAGAAGSVLGTLLVTNKNNANYSLAGIQGLVAKSGEKPMYGHYNNDVPASNDTITASCKNKEAAARFLNYGYTKEGHLLYNFGIEGESYTMQDSKPVYTDKILNPGNGLSVQESMADYMLAYGNGPFVQDKDYLLQYYKLDAQKTALKNWSDHDAAKYKLPSYSVSSDKVNEYSSTLSDIKTYVEEMTIKYVNGTESLDTFDTKYLSTLKSMGLDRVTQIIQDAVKEYNAR